MYNSKVSAAYLYHFTKDIDTVISILSNGFYPRTAIEDVSFMMPNLNDDDAKVGIPMVCFTDIPIELADTHRKTYGRYGIGMKKEWGIRNGLNPINYIVKGSAEYMAFNHLQNVIVNNTLELVGGERDHPKMVKLMEAVMNFSGFLKEYSSKLDLDEKPYYDEREWRYLPPFIDEHEKKSCNRLRPNQVKEEGEITALNSHMKELYTLKMKVDDIGEIILPNMEDTAEFFHEAELLFAGTEIIQLREKVKILDIGE